MMAFAKLLAAGAIVVSALLGLGRLVVQPYALNLTKRSIADRTNLAFQSQQTARELAGRLARDNARDLEPLSRRFPEDPDVHLIRAANLRLIGRTHEAMQEYALAVAYEPTPELLMNLGETQLELGLDENARESFDRAIRFNSSVSDSIARIYEQRSAR